MVFVFVSFCLSQMRPDINSLSAALSEQRTEDREQRPITQHTGLVFNNLCSNHTLHLGNKDNHPLHYELATHGTGIPEEMLRALNSTTQMSAGQKQSGGRLL